MVAAKGYFSLLQYCPNRSRMESLNVGVLLLSPEKQYVGTRVVKSSRRVEHAYDLPFIDSQTLDAVNGMAVSLNMQITPDIGLQGLEQLAATRTGIVFLSAPRYASVAEDPDETLTYLFEELVQSVREQTEPFSAGKR